MVDEHDLVYTVSDFWDSPRSGIANFRGKPHAYKCLFDESADDWSEVFLLQSIDDETFRLAMEGWQIWKRWENAYYGGQTSLEAHPALQVDRRRYEEIAAILEPRLRIDPKRAVHARGNFVAIHDRAGDDEKWVVRWSEHENAG